MGGHLVVLAAFFGEPDPPAFGLGEVVVDAHGDDGRDAGEGVDHGGDEGAVTEADEVGDVDGVEELAGLGGEEDGGLAAFDLVLGSSDGGGGVCGDDLADNEPVEELADGGEVLFHRRRGAPVALDVGGDVDGLDALERKRAELAPLEELPHGAAVGGPGVRVPNVRGEELEKPPGGVLAGVGDQVWEPGGRRGHHGPARACQRELRIGRGGTIGHSLRVT